MSICNIEDTMRVLAKFCRAEAFIVLMQFNNKSIKRKMMIPSWLFDLLKTTAVV